MSKINISILLCSAVTSARSKVWLEKINFAKVLNAPDAEVTAQLTYTSATTHVVLDDSNLVLLKAKLKSWSGLPSVDNNVKVVDFRWIIKSLENKALVDETLYIVKGLRNELSNDSNNTVKTLQMEVGKIDDSCVDKILLDPHQGQLESRTGISEYQGIDDIDIPQTESSPPVRSKAALAFSNLTQSLSKPSVISPSTGSYSVALKSEGSSSTDSSPNQLIINVFKQLEKVRSKSDQFRISAYRRACVALGRLPKVTTVEQLRNEPNFGPSSLQKIDEILRTGGLKQLRDLQNDPKTISLTELEGIWGVGPDTAKELYSKGFRCVKDLQEKSEAELEQLLGKQQMIGLRWYDDFNQRIPRSEVEQIVKIVSDEAQKLLPGVQCVCCGSFRRGRPTCGDVDILLAPPPDQENITMLPSLLKQLEQSGFLTDHLALPGKRTFIHHKRFKNKEPSPKYRKRFQSSDRQPVHDVDSDSAVEDQYTEEFDTDPSDNGDTETQEGHSSYMGVCKLRGEETLHRRIDIKTYSRSRFPFALFYFTGSDLFNRSVRYYADRKLGYQLSDVCLRPVIRGPDRKVVTTGKLIPCYSERDIFDRLGLEYKEPWEREGKLDPSVYSHGKFSSPVKSRRNLESPTELEY